MRRRSTRWLLSTTCITVVLIVRVTFAGQVGLGDDPAHFDGLIETAWQNRDLAFLDANLTGDAHYSIHGTAEHSKAEWLESVGRSSGAPRTLVAVQIRRQPDAVVTTGHIRVASSPSSNAEVQIYFVRRYVPESGSWKLASHRTIREERGAPPVHRSLSTGGFAFDAQALRQGNGVSAPRLLRHVAPQYSADGMRAGIEGKVRLEFVVKPDGSVGDVRILRSLDAIFGLDEAAVIALKQCRFEPGTKDGVAVPVIATMESAFVLR